jgi:hypothetical protein
MQILDDEELLAEFPSANFLHSVVSLVFVQNYDNVYSFMIRFHFLTIYDISCGIINLQIWCTWTMGKM